MTFDDLRMLIGPFLLVVGSLLPIVNPLGSAPIFLVMTRGSDEATRHKLAVQVAFNSFILLFASMVFGTLVLKLFGLSVPVVQIAGGAVLCALGWNLLNKDQPAPTDAEPVPGEVMIARAFYPLTLPVTVDPGAGSTTAVIADPKRSSGTPTTAASCTDGWSLRTSSTSSGYTFSPPVLMQSDPRPSRRSEPSASTVAMSPGMA